MTWAEMTRDEQVDHLRRAAKAQRKLAVEMHDAGLVIPARGAHRLADRLEQHVVRLTHNPAAGGGRS